MTVDVTGGHGGPHFFILFCSMFRQARSNQARSGCDYFANQNAQKQIWRKSSVNENKLLKLSIVGRTIGDSHR